MNCKNRVSYRCSIFSLETQAKSCKLINILCLVEVSIKVKYTWVSLQEWCFGNYLEISFVPVVHCIDLKCHWPEWVSGRCRVSAALNSLQSCRVGAPVAFQKLTLTSVGPEHFSKVQAIQVKTKKTKSLKLNLRICFT